MYAESSSSSSLNGHPIAPPAVRAGSSSASSAPLLSLSDSSPPQRTPESSGRLSTSSPSPFAPTPRSSLHTCLSATTSTQGTEARTSTVLASSGSATAHTSATTAAVAAAVSAVPPPPSSYPLASLSEAPAATQSTLRRCKTWRFTSSLPKEETSSVPTPPILSGATCHHSPAVHEAEEDAEEVHSCITLSSTHTTPDASQVSCDDSVVVSSGPAAAAPRDGVAVALQDREEAEEEEGEEAPPLLSSGSTAPSESTPAVACTPAMKAEGEREGCAVDASPSPANPHAAPLVPKAEEATRPYRVLDSESSGLPSHPPPTATESTEASAGASEPPSDSAEAPPVSGVAALSDEQRYAFHLAVKEHRSIFITGGAGTGKSHILRTIIQHLPFSSTFVTATTGIAALNLSGMTLHSFVGCGVPRSSDTREKILGVVCGKAKRVRAWRLCRVLIIDEVSMLDAAFFDLVDYVARRVRNRPDEPFGGIQLILSGDFLQLPPVVKDRRGPGAFFCFESETWIKVNPKICLLSTPFRQRDLRFFGILNEMRFGALQPESIALLHSIDTSNRVNFVRREIVRDGGGNNNDEDEEHQQQPQRLTVGLKRERGEAGGGGAPTSLSQFVDPPARPGERQTRLELVDGSGRPVNAPFDGYTILRATRLEVEAQNDKYFHQLDTEVFSYVGSHTGAGTFPEPHLTPVVRLRKGCRVMVIKNFDQQTRLVNGSTGTVTGFVSFLKGFEFRTTNMTPSDARGICVGRGRDSDRRHTMLPIVAFDARNPQGQAQLDEIVVEPQEWVEKEGDNIKSRSVQIPLVLAYAITIHKSQGMSLTQVDIDFGKVFEAGQSYVALSRCTDLSRVRLHGFNAHLVSANSIALAYYKALALQQHRLAWQRQHTPHVVAAMEDAEARACTPYGYLLTNDMEVLRRFGEEDSSRGAPLSSDDDGDARGDSLKDEEGSAAASDTEEDKSYSSGERRKGGHAKSKEGRMPGAGRAPLAGSHHSSSLRSAARRRVGRADSDPSRRTETSALDDLRRRITPLLTAADMMKRMVLRYVQPLTEVCNSRLVMDVDALFHLVTGPESTILFDLLFGQQDNMIRLPLCVPHLVEEAAAYRGVSMTPSTTPEFTTRSPWRSRGEAGVGGEPESEESARPDSALLEASDVAAEALAVMERAKQDLILDVQRPEQRVDLPEPQQEWLRYCDVLPLLLRPPAAPSAATTAAAASSLGNGDSDTRGGFGAALGDDAATPQEVNFILNRDPREGLQHREIIEYALFLKGSFGDGVAVCTGSIVLAAYALAWGLRVVSVEGKP